MTNAPVSPLRLERQRRGLSQVALAALAGCHPSAVSLAERGGFITPTLAAKLAAALEVAPDAILPKRDGACP
jgi:transcriptional regulator with XRE-family HTH domain